MTTISIVIPAYNAARTITRCLESIFQQTYREYEIIVVNDGSRDATETILKKYKNTLKIINQTNQGAAAARNTGARYATGEYLIFCDADIVLEKECLQKMAAALDTHPEAAYAYSDFIFGLKKFKLWPFDVQRLREQPYIHTTSLIRKEDFPGFDEALKRFQDWDLWLTMLSQNKKGVYINEILFTVQTGGTMSRWAPKIFYRIPWLSVVKKYRAAEKIIKEKHSL
jgi:glycosyltransferase involved in cell wall biosynthesis